MRRFSPRGALVSLLLVALASGVGWAHHRFYSPSDNPVTVRVLIPKGTGLKGVTALLIAGGVLRDRIDGLAFMAMTAWNGDAHRLRAGEYDVPPHVRLAQIAHMLVTGQGIVRYPLTVPEGLTTAKVLALVRAMPVLSGRVAVTPGEGTLLPQTYYVERGDARDAVIHRMMVARNQVLAELWANRAPGLPYANPEQAVIVASMVARETAIADERPKVAAVFLNRLAKGMPLACDPTVIYGLAPKTGELGRPLTFADLKVDTPYNTYIHTGLPPGPIDNPGRASLEAALHPAKTDALYFVATGNNGRSVFSATLAAHDRNIAHLRRIERKRRRRARRWRHGELADAVPLPETPPRHRRHSHRAVHHRHRARTGRRVPLPVAKPAPPGSPQSSDGSRAPASKR